MAESDHGGGRATRFSVDATIALGSAAFGLLIGLIGLSMATAQQASTGDRVPGLLAVSFAVWFAYRGATAGKVTVGDQMVTTRSFLRTRHYRASELASAEVRIGRTGPNGFGRQYLVLRRVDGSDVAFRGLNCKPVCDGQTPTVVEQCVAAISSALEDDPG